MLTTVRLGGTLLAVLLTACPEESYFAHEGRPFSSPSSVANSPLFVHFPELDQRIQRHDAQSGRRLRTIYPDLWDPEVRGIRDFVVGDGRAFVLLSRYGTRDDNRLYVVDLQGAAATDTLALAPNPQRLAWNTAGELLVGHFASHEGGPGRLTVVDTDHSRLLTVVDLRGSCLSATGDQSRAFVVEQTRRRTGDDKIFSRYSLADIDLDAGQVSRRLPLPAGAWQVVIGPTGLLYVSHASGSGLHASDGTISVIDPQTWTLVDRIRLEMVVRKMASNRDLLAVNLLSRSGEAWFAALLPDHRVLYDFKLPGLVSGELVLIDGSAYLARRGQPEILTVRLDDRPTLRRIRIPDASRVDRAGLLRAAVGRKK